MFETIFKKSSFKMIGLSLLLIISIMFPYGQQSIVRADTSGGNVVLGYYTSWAPPTGLDPNKVTHINYAFADVCWEGEHGNIDNAEIMDGGPKTWPCEDLDGNVSDGIENGTVVLYDSEADLVELKNLTALKDVNKSLKTLISVGGWTLSNNISLVARTEETREVFAQSAVDFIREFNMDGLDLDWEYPVAAGMDNNHRDPSDKQNHTLLLQAVRDALDIAGVEDNKEYLVTIAGAATWAYAENNELSKIAEIVDYAAIMAYDINGTWSGLTGHNAPLHYSEQEAGVRGWSFGVETTPTIYGGIPANKVVLGLPFYGHSWAGCNEDDDGVMIAENGPYQECKPAWEQQGLGGGTIGYDVVKPIVNQDGYKFYFDNIAKAPYLYNEGLGEFISYDNVESIGYKVNFIKEQGLAGAMIWDLGTDDSDYNLLKAVSSGLGITAELPEPDLEPEPAPDPEPEPEPAPDPELDPEPIPERTLTPEPEPGNGTGNDDDDVEKENNDGNEVDQNDGKTPIIAKDESNKSGQELPETATNLFNYLLIGGTLLLAGMAFYLFQRKRRIKS